MRARSCRRSTPTCTSASATGWRKTLRAARLPRAPRLHRRAGAGGDQPEVHGGVRDEPPQQHGLHPRRPSSPPSASALSYAVGEWARIWPLQGLIRAMGAYFVRRNSGDPLYRMVLQRYVQMATEGGVPQAMYPEGGLTRRRPAARAQARPARLHAQGLQPRRRARPGVHSGRHQLRPRDRRPHAAAQARRRRRSAAACCARCASPAVIWRASSCSRCCGRRYRFGYACVNFGQPYSMRAFVTGAWHRLPRARRCRTAQRGRGRRPAR